MTQALFFKLSGQAAALLHVRRGLFALLAASSLVNVLLAVHLVTRTDETRTVVLAPEAGEPYIAMRERVSPNLLERFAVTSLALALNLNPTNARWQMQTFLRNVSPENHAAIAEKFEEGVRELERNHASSAFFAHAATVDAEKGVVCLAGERRLLIAQTVTESAALRACLATTVRMGRLWITRLTFEKAAKGALPEAAPAAVPLEASVRGG